MTLWIERTALEGRVAEDLRRICRDPGMTFDLLSVQQNRDHSGQVLYDVKNRTISSLGSDLIAYLIGIPQPVCVAGRPPTHVAVPGDPIRGIYRKLLREVHGQTSFRTLPNQDPLPTWAKIMYDPTDDNGRGYWVYEDTQDDIRIHSASDAILFHELSHARHAYERRLIGVSGSDLGRTNEQLAVDAENQYLVSTNRKRRRLRGGGTGFRDGDTCFVATAAYGSPIAPEVEALRAFRDEVLLQTRAGTRFFDDFYAEYYRISPPIAEAVRSNPRLAELIRVGIVAPLLHYLQMAAAIPHAPLDEVPQPWRAFLSALIADFNFWARMLPLPDDLDLLTPPQAAAEVAAALRYLLHDGATRSKWLRGLELAGHVPLSISEDERAGIAERLAADGATTDEIRTILGRDNPAFSHIDEDDVPLDYIDPRERPYTVQLRNTTNVSFDEVVLFYNRRSIPGVVFLGTTPFAPNAVEILPLGTCGTLRSYTVGFFLGGRMVARIPEDAEAMTPALAATLDPNRLDECTDSWAVYESNFLPLSQLTYTVVVRNQTPDTWDDVTLAYTLEGETAVIVETSPVTPGGQATIPIGPCDRLVGYSFAIFVDGLAVDFDPRSDVEVLQFPAEGRMNALRSLQEHLTPDWQPCLDVWEVG